MKIKISFIILFIMAGLSFTYQFSLAQDTIYISLSIPTSLSDVVGLAVNRFQESYPNIQIIIHDSDFIGYPSPAENIEEHLYGIRNYVSSSDVVYVNPYLISNYATQANYFLDLSPLVSVDATIDSRDFIPTVWQSFQWDNGIWALPASSDVFVLSYNQNLFDAKGIPYPTENWLFTDLANAARLLTSPASDGQPTLPGLFVSDVGIFLRGYLSEPLFDNTTNPNMPQFARQDIADVLDQWVQLEQEGAASTSYSGSIGDIPLRFGQLYAITQSTQSAQSEDLQILGNGSSLFPHGFAISNGTAFPNEAYLLLRTLIDDPSIATTLFSVSLAHVDSGIQDGSAVSTEMYNTILVSNTLPFEQLRYSDYLKLASEQLHANNEDVLFLLESLEIEASNNLIFAQNQNNQLLMVATSVPETILESNEISIHFGMTFPGQSPNSQEWNDVIDNFVQVDPEIGQIVIEDLSQTDSLPDTVSDCFYFPEPYYSVENVLDLRPLMGVDSSFNADDFLPTTIIEDPTTHGIYAYPMVIQPRVLWYNENLFNQLSIPLPESNWDVYTFIDVLSSLKTISDEPPFRPDILDNNTIFMLIALLGGKPFGNQNESPSTNFSDASTVEAIRYTLDLYKNQYIEYHNLSNSWNIGNLDFTFIERPIYTQPINYLNYRGVRNLVNSPYKLTVYPISNYTTVVSYAVGAGYISASSLHPQACYRWLSYLSNQPHLFFAMPTRLSLIDSQTTLITQGQELVNLYNDIAMQLQAPNLITFPLRGHLDPLTITFARLWLYQVFDNYIANDIDLESALLQAENNSLLLEDCVSNLDSSDSQRYFNDTRACAFAIDPSLGQILPDTNDSEEQQ